MKYPRHPSFTSMVDNRMRPRRLSLIWATLRSWWTSEPVPPCCPVCGGYRCKPLKSEKVEGGEWVTTPAGERIFIPDEPTRPT